MSDIVTDWPVWNECAMRQHVPAEYEIRKRPEDRCIAIWDPENQLHVALELKDFNLKTLPAVLTNLRQAANSTKLHHK